MTIEVLSADGTSVVQTSVQRFDNRAWLVEQGGRYVLVDEQDSLTPATAVDELIATGGLAELVGITGAVALLLTLLVGRRRRQPAPSVRDDEQAIVVRPGRRIQTFGSLHIWDGQEDLAPQLLKRPVIAFLWLYMLARTVDDASAAPTKANLGDEAYPGYGAAAQRSRIRDRLRDIRANLPPALAATVKVEGEVVRLDLTGWHVDAVEIRAAAESLADSLDEELLKELAELVGRGSGVFLPEWEDVARITEGRGAAGSFVDDLRLQLEGAVVEAQMAIGRTLMNQGRAREALMHLRVAQRLRPNREDAARLLARALAETGQHVEAASLDEDRA